MARTRLQISASATIAASTAAAKNQERSFDAQALPGDDDVARAVGKPGDAVGDASADHDQNKGRRGSLRGRLVKRRERGGGDLPARRNGGLARLRLS